MDGKEGIKITDNKIESITRQAWIRLMRQYQARLDLNTTSIMDTINLISLISDEKFSKEFLEELNKNFIKFTGAHWQFAAFLNRFTLDLPKPDGELHNRP